MHRYTFELGMVDFQIEKHSELLRSIPVLKYIVTGLGKHRNNRVKIHLKIRATGLPYNTESCQS